MIATPERLKAFLGDDHHHEDIGEQEAAVLDAVYLFVQGYTRGRGFDEDGIPNEELAAVILTAAARLYANPDGTVTTERLTAEDGSGTATTRSGGFQGFSLAEQFVLNRYRRRAA